MGLWIKNDDGSIEKVAGSGGGGGGTFDGDHVLTGDVANPPEELAVGQLMWDGVEGGGSGGSGDGGPHDHAEYALVEHDHDEFTHDHDYLPLSGGTLTGDLQVGGTVATINPGSEGAPAYTSTLYPTTGMYGHAEGVFFTVAGNWTFGSWADRVGIRKDLHVAGDLQVDGNADLIINAPADAWARTTRGTVFADQGMTSGTQGSFGVAMTSNGYRNDAGKWSSLGLNNSIGATTIELLPTGRFYVRAASNHPTGSASSPPICFTVTEAGPTFRAQPSKTRSTDEVLERAETAEFPPEDDEGVAMMDGHDEVPLFEVVTALLAKVKELSAEIKELKGA